ncbi:MAG: CDP-diacylglycerol---serine O-phosphatidyltransferase [Tenuifilum sp.]|uniref:CDP-alcohol phosphatidyltransferase family protein n=1 Tax=Tenuifilum sp. TaxID=2760880 RepID=UPI0024AA4C12|nr:CDP-alcohol phosphatidyltransferase family protein [Tenuifilum sp.]MDI3527432.1 CDP-diacylglycerol---serine O-phosphatidyltransferase [Tenuifilum sp.]
MSNLLRYTRHIPNGITLMNLLSGCLSIVAAFEGRLELAGVFIIISGVLDFFDGFTARLIGAYTQLGKELDSLSDVVSFGVAPAVILYHLLRQSLGLTPDQSIFDGHLLLLLPFAVAVFSSLRLGLFNIDERQTSLFIGLPTPANAFLIIGLVFGANSSWVNIYNPIISSSTVLIVLSVVQSFLLVCELPMFSLKIKSLKPAVAYKQLTFLVGAILLIVVFRKASLSLVIVWYVVLSVFYYLFDKLIKKQV